MDLLCFGWDYHLFEVFTWVGCLVVCLLNFVGY